ncbi:MAG: polysaccharide deacetylase family protein [Chloroflexi bacterium]|nr:polysaccharide deacetylase family protein [Chloroflexota bacterium]
MSFRGLTRPPILLLWLAAALFIAPTLSACDSTPAATPTAIQPAITPTNPPAPPTYTPPPPTPTTAATATPVPIPLADRSFVPILCYHHIRDWAQSDTADDKGYIVPPSKFEATLKYLKENGYHSVVAQQVYDYYANGQPLPSKPIMLSFDDDNDNQYTNAVPLLKKYGFNATFFIMTVTLDKENYMTSDQIKELDKEGFDLQPHTWDHRPVTTYKTDADWQRQIVEPKQTLEKLLGHPTPFFAYPYGIYDAASAAKIKSYGYKAAFRLSELSDKNTDPLFAIKRYIANPYFTDDQFQSVLTGNW